MANETAALWNKKYSTEEYVYGTARNDFLAASVAGRSVGKVFSIGEGEGRNACFLASLPGSDVHCIDASEVGVSKTLKLASEQGVLVHATQGFLEDLVLEPNSIDTFVSIFCHTVPEVRSRVHRMAQDALRPGGMFILEAYTPQQVAFGTGGPKVENLLLTESQLKSDFDRMDFLVLREIERDVREGILHTGHAAVLQCLALKSK